MLIKTRSSTRMKQNKDSGENKVSSRDTLLEGKQEPCRFCVFDLEYTHRNNYRSYTSKNAFLFHNFFLIIKPFRPAVPGAH